MSMSVADAIKWAQGWLEDPGAPDPVTDTDRAANTFAYTAWVLFTERRVALDALSRAGFGNGTLNERIQAMVAACARPQ